MEPISNFLRTPTFAGVPAGASPRADALIAIDPDDFRRMLNSGMLPAGPVLVTGDLKLTDEDALDKLPVALTVRGRLDLSGCTSLTSLPEGLTVCGNLYLTGCTSLASLPESFILWENLYLGGCTALMSLPNWITELGPRRDGRNREIDIRHTGLYRDLMERWKKTMTPGLRILFSPQDASDAQLLSKHKEEK